MGDGFLCVYFMVQIGLCIIWKAVSPTFCESDKQSFQEQITLLGAFREEKEEKWCDKNEMFPASPCGCPACNISNSVHGQVFGDKSRDWSYQKRRQTIRLT